MINDSNKTLHVISGYSAAGCLKQALRIRNRQVLVGDPDLHCGPAPAMADLISWHRLRKAYSDDLFSNAHAHMFEDPMPPTVTIGDEPETGPHIDGERLWEAREVVVWVARGLHEQLLLAWIAFLFDRFNFDHAKLRVVQFPRSHRNWPLFTVGQLNPEAINRLNPGSHPLNPEQVEDLRKAWRAYTSNEPGQLTEYLAGSGSLPFLRPAMAQLVRRYPDVRNGLSGWDEVLLQHTIENGPVLLRVLGHAMASCDTPDWVSDAYLFDRLTKLGGPDVPSPLVSFSSSEPPEKRPRVGITDFGRKVLAGEANHVVENGIDDWVGGVHLSSGGRIVYRDGDTLLPPD